MGNGKASFLIILFFRILKPQWKKNQWKNESVLDLNFFYEFAGGDIFEGGIKGVSWTLYGR